MGSFPFRCLGKGQVLVQYIPQAPAPWGGMCQGSCGRGGGGGRRPGLLFLGHVPPASCPGALPRHSLASAWQQDAGACSPQPLEQIVDLASPMSLAPQDPQDARWGSGQPQRVQEEGAG